MTSKRNELRLGERLRHDARRLDLAPPSGARERVLARLAVERPGGRPADAATRPRGRWELGWLAALAFVLALTLFARLRTGATDPLESVRLARASIPTGPERSLLDATVFGVLSDLRRSGPAAFVSASLADEGREGANLAGPLQREMRDLVSDSAHAAEVLTARLPGPLRRSLLALERRDS